MKVILRKVGSVLSAVLVVVIVLTAVLLVGTRLMGFRVFNILSGSMSPTYQAGDLIFVRPADPSTVHVGEPITFVVNEDLVVVTHRVVRIDAEQECFYTKGDANDTEDASPVRFQNLVGVPQFCLPKLGYVTDFIQYPPGIYITLGAGAALVVLVFLPDVIRYVRRRKAQPSDDPADAPVQEDETDKPSDEA